MNWTMGRYVDELDDEQRDRILTAHDFTDGEWWEPKAKWWSPFSRPCGCLVGTAENFGAVSERRREFVERRHEAYEVSRGGGLTWQSSAPAFRYSDACLRFGKARVVRAIKTRAAATTSAAVEARPSDPSHSQATPERAAVA